MPLETKRSRAFAITRWITGGYYRHGYVYLDNRAIMGCKHKHRRFKTAQNCADNMLRTVLGRGCTSCSHRVEDHSDFEGCCMDCPCTMSPREIGQVLGRAKIRRT